MKKLLFVLSLLSTQVNLIAQGVKFKDPVKISDAINSQDRESMPLFSDDGDMLYFSRSPKQPADETGGQDIWLSRREQGKGWQVANNNMAGLNNDKDNMVVGVGYQGSRVYLINSYDPMRKKRVGVAYSDFDGTAWSDPQGLLEIKAKSAFKGFFMHPSEQVLLTSMKGRGSSGAEDIYVNVKNEEGKWGKPINLGKTINTSGSEVSPFLSEDKKVLYFSSTGHTGYGGADIFMSERQDDTWQAWSTPVNLGPVLNSEGFDAYFTINRKDEIYFVSDRDEGQEDIYLSQLIADVEEEMMEVEEEPGVTDIEGAENEEEEWTPETIIVLFNFDSFKILTLFNDKLGKVSEYLKKEFGSQVSLVGYTDSVGPEEYNQRLSVKRAEAVKSFFTNKGVQEEQINVDGKGESNPIADNKTEEGRYKNRRVEVIIHQMDKRP